MNGNDLLNALSGLDPNYIDEAAFELHGDPASKKRAKTAAIRKGFFVALPAVAAILLTVTVALPAIMRLGSTSSAPASSDSAATAPMEEAASDSAATYEAEEPMSYGDTGAYESASEADSAEYEAEAMAEPDMADSTSNAAAESAKTPESEDLNAAKTETAGTPGFETATYENGILTIEVTSILPKDIADMDYVITQKSADGNDETIAEGTLRDIMVERYPLTLDLTGTDLPDGTYEFSIGEDTIEFIK